MVSGMGEGGLKSLSGSLPAASDLWASEPWRKNWEGSLLVAKAEGLISADDSRLPVSIWEDLGSVMGWGERHWVGLGDL